MQPNGEIKMSENKKDFKDNNQYFSEEDIVSAEETTNKNSSPEQTTLNKNSVPDTETENSNDFLSEIILPTTESDVTVKKNKLTLSDIWFYYKWHVLIVLFFVTIFTVLIVQTVTKEKFDVRMLYAGPVILSDENKTAITDALNQNIDSDYNGDGQKNSELFDLILMTNEEIKEMNDKGVDPYFLNPSFVNDNRETLAVNSMAGDYVIFLIDADYYQNLHDNGAFVTLDSMGITNGTRYDDCALYLNSLDFAKFYTAFHIFPDDTLICVKQLSLNAKNKAAMLWEQNKKYFKTLTEIKLPEGFVPAK